MRQQLAPPTKLTSAASARPLRVAYEISTLAYGFGNAAEMAGVYRVIVRLLEQARRRPELTSRYVAETHPLAEVRAHAALEHLWPGASRDLLSSWRVPLPDALHSWLDARAQHSVRPLSFAARAARRVAHTFAQKRADAESCDILHSLTYGLPEGERIKARARFLTVHDMIPVKFPEYYGERGEIMRAHFTAVAHSARGPRDFVICSSEAARRDYCDFTALAPERVFVTPWAAGEEFRPEPDPARHAEVRRKYHLPDSPFVLSVCTLEPRKNLPQLIRAFVELLKENLARDLQLVLAGAKGWSFEQIFQSIDGAGDFRARIHCPGRIEDPDLAALYSAAEVFVYPSLYEGFGLPPLEAMQCGVPVITSNTSSLPEVVGEAGITVDPRDARAFLEAIRAVLDSRELRRGMRERGLTRAQHFSWERTVDLTLEAYRAALAQVHD